eukprot:scaffold135990_cov21-Tisochrysis_lutea.AAC.3
MWHHVEPRGTSGGWSHLQRGKLDGMTSMRDIIAWGTPPKHEVSDGMERTSTRKAKRHSDQNKPDLGLTRKA